MTADVLSKLRPARVFKNSVDHESAGGVGEPGARPHITSVTFDSKGERALTAGEDDMFVLYDAAKGKQLKRFYSKKYGIAHARFTHSKENILHASTKVNNDVRHHDLHGNKYISYFKGHTGIVRSIHLNPMNDTFLTAGDDQTVRLWDVRTNACTGMLNNVGGSTIAAFDSSGLVFAVACSATQTIMLYDCTNLDNAPFNHGQIVEPGSAHALNITSLAFSNDGQFILVGTDGDAHLLVDAYDLRLVRRLEGHAPLGRVAGAHARALSGEETGFTADSRWAFSGGADGAVAFWALDTAQDAADVTMRPTRVVRPDGARLSRAVRFNPRLCMLAVGGDELSFWLPEKADDARREGW
ncbi:hypothetical protein Q5752_001132 [Cryptotrichosporon argae]